MAARAYHFLEWFPNRPVELRSDQSYTLGRGTSCDVFINDPQASRMHAEIAAEGEGFMITDLASANGTFVNGEAITARVLQPDDEIRIGSHVLKFRVEEAEEVIAQFRRQAHRVREFDTVVGRKPGEGGLSGNLEDVDLGQIVQVLEGGRKTGRLLITSVGVSASVYFRDGRVIAAEFESASTGSRSDREAVYEVFALRGGIFEFLSEDVRIEPRMNESTQALLLESMRRIDEEARAGDFDGADTIVLQKRPDEGDG